MTEMFKPWAGCMGETLGEDRPAGGMEMLYWLANRMISPYSPGRHLFIVVNEWEVVEAVSHGVRRGLLSDYHGQKVRFLWPTDASLEDGLFAAQNASLMIGREYDYGLWVWLASVVVPKWLSHPWRKCRPQELPEDTDRQYICYEVGGKAWNPVPDGRKYRYGRAHDISPYAPDIPHSFQQSIDEGRLVVVGAWGAV